MIFLLLGIISSGLIPLVLRYAEKSKVNKHEIIMVNYIIATIASGIVLLIYKPDLYKLKESLMSTILVQLKLQQPI